MPTFATATLCTYIQHDIHTHTKHTHSQAANLIILLFACCVDPTVGHTGKSRTLYKIKEKNLWHGLVKDFEEIVTN